MSYTITHLDNPEAILVKFEADFDFASEYASYHNDIIETLDSQTEQVYMIIDILDASISFNNLLTGTRDARMNASTNAAQHANTRELVLVTNSSLMKASIDGFKKLGLAKKISAYSSMDEALNNIF